MNNGAFGENFPYSNFHDLNLDWIIKIAKDFLDQYTHIQDTVTQGNTDLQNTYNTLNELLQDWYTEHQDYLNQYLTDSIIAFSTAAERKAAQTIETIPADYTALFNHVLYLQNYMDEVTNKNLMGMDSNMYYPVYIPAGTTITVSTANGENFPNQSKLRIYYFDINGNGDWFGLYNNVHETTHTFNTDIYWLSWHAGVTPATNIMVNFGNEALTYVPYNTNLHTFGYKGRIPSSANLNDYKFSGWWYFQNLKLTQNSPSNSYATYGILKVYCKGTNSDLITQEITDENGIIYIRTLSQSGIATSWVQQGTARDIIFNRTLQQDKIVSLSGNYFDFEKAVWHDGIYDSRNGSVSGSAPYKYTYVPLQGPGEYVKTGLVLTFGTNMQYFALLDENKQFLTSIQGTPIESDTTEAYSCKVNLTDTMLEKAKYTVLHYHTTYDYVPKLYYNSTFISLLDKSVQPNYGFATDPIYRKEIVCDGDSIATGNRDLPSQFGAYFGRFKNNYQITGQNYAVNGGTITDKSSTLVDGNPRHSIVLNIETIHTEHPDLDYLILEGGANDADLIGSFNNDTPPSGFGTWSETDFSGNYDTTTFCGACDELFYKANMYYPHAKIGFIIAMEMGTSTNIIVNRKRYFDELEKIANKWHIPVLNLWKECPADARIASYYNPSITGSENVTAKSFYFDGQHPTSYGYDKMQNTIDKWMHSL